MSWSPLAAHGRTFCDDHRVGDALPFYFELDLRCKCRWRDLLHFLGLKFPLHLKVSRRSRKIWAYSHSNSFHMYSCGHSTCCEWMSPAYSPPLQVIGREPESSQTAWRGRLNTKVWSVTDLEKKVFKRLSLAIHLSLFKSPTYSHTPAPKDNLHHADTGDDADEPSRPWCWHIESAKKKRKKKKGGGRGVIISLHLCHIISLYQPMISAIRSHCWLWVFGPKNMLWKQDE